MRANCFIKSSAHIIISSTILNAEGTFVTKYYFVSILTRLIYMLFVSKQFWLFAAVQRLLISCFDFFSVNFDFLHPLNPSFSNVFRIAQDEIFTLVIKCHSAKNRAR